MCASRAHLETLEQASNLLHVHLSQRDRYRFYDQPNLQQKKWVEEFRKFHNQHLKMREEEMFLLFMKLHRPKWILPPEIPPPEGLQWEEPAPRLMEPMRATVVRAYVSRYT